MNWETTETGYRCTRHDETFSRGEVCQKCVSDPGPEVTAEGDLSEHVDKELLARAFSFRSDSKKLRRLGVNIIEDNAENTREWHAAVKVIDSATKLERLALELEDKVSQRDHDRYLVRRAQEMAGIRGNDH